MTPPATGETTPTTKRKRNAPVTPNVNPGDSVLYLTAALKAANDAVAAQEAATPQHMDTETEEAEVESNQANAPEPVSMGCSLSSLPPAFNSFADTISKKVSAFMMSKRAKLRVIKKLEIRESIPLPIRFQFELSGSKEVTGNDEFFGLAAACSMAIQTCQADLKVQMVMAARMEIDLLDQKSRETFYQALQGFAQLILIETATDPVIPTAAQVRLLALSTLDRNVNCYTTPDNFNLNPITLFSEYKKMTDDTNPTWIQGSADDIYCSNHADDITNLTKMMFETIVQRWNDKLQAMNEKEKAALLESTQRSFFKTQSTKEAANAIALEHSMDESKMDSVIADKVAKENKALRAKIDQLETLIRRTNITDGAKNTTRGANLARASNQKTNTKKKAPPPDPSSRKQPAKSNRRKPAAAAASACATSRKGTAEKSKKKNKKQAGSLNKKNVAFAT
jgi:hypothetical protein